MKFLGKQFQVEMMTEKLDKNMLNTMKEMNEIDEDVIQKVEDKKEESEDITVSGFYMYLPYILLASIVLVGIHPLFITLPKAFFVFLSIVILAGMTFISLMLQGLVSIAAMQQKAAKNISILSEVMDNENENKDPDYFG